MQYLFVSAEQVATYVGMWVKKYGNEIYHISVLILGASGAILIAYSVSAFHGAIFHDSPVAVVDESKFGWGIRLIVLSYAIDLVSWIYRVLCKKEQYKL